MKDKLKWAAAAAVGGVIESWGVAAFSAGAGFVIGLLNAILAYDNGLPYYQVVLVFALTFGGISAGLFLLTVPLLRYVKLRNERQQAAERAATEGARPSPQLTQTGVQVNPVIAPNFYLGAEARPAQPTAQKRKEQEQVVAPVLERAGTRIIKRGFNLHEGELIDEEFYGSESQLAHGIEILDVVLARFHYRADVGVPPSINLMAHVFIQNAEGESKDYDAVWWREESLYKEFYAGRRHELIIAIIPARQTDRIIAYEHDYAPQLSGRLYTAETLKPILHRLDGDKFLVKVELIMKRGNDPIGVKRFDYHLILGQEHRLEEVAQGFLPYLPRVSGGESAAKRAYKIERLKELVREGESLRWASLAEDGMRIRTFNDNAAAFLSDYYDESHVERFKSEGADYLRALLNGLLNA